MNRPWQIWVAFAACLVVAVCAVGWLSMKAIETDRQSAIEENARLALWRMDSSLTSLVATESARPYFTYNAFYSADRNDGKAAAKPSAAAVVPSPLLTQATPKIKLHFQIDPDQKFTSPEVPLGKFESKAVPEYLSDVQCRANGGMLADLHKVIDVPLLVAQCPNPESATTMPLVGVQNPYNQFGNSAALPNSGNFNFLNTSNAQQMPNTGQAAQADANDNEGQQQRQQAAYQPDNKLAQESQGKRGQMEWEARNRSFVQSNVKAQSLGINNDLPNTPGASSASGEVQMSMMTPLWVGADLILARRVAIDNRDYVQGCLLDWDALKQQLLSDVSDLLPDARLQPTSNTSEDAESHRLASLPVVLLPGSVIGDAATGLSPIKRALLIAWGSLVLAALAVAALLQGVISLSERRGAFVSAVTHELRTPLTTFRMYAEMLAGGMVREESDRRSYLETLKLEAERLTHLVANVLAYARLERGRPGGRIETVTVERLLEVATQRLADRASQVQFVLSIESADGVMQRLVKADPAAVEQILFNLVDNACKYAALATDRTLRLSASAEENKICIRLCDHGGGIEQRERKRLFQPFRKSASDAAHSAPGVGLGLALSRRMARDMHGDLRYEPGTAGACFALILPSQ